MTPSAVCATPLHNTIVAIPQLKGGAGKASTMKHILKKKCGVCPSDQETFQNLFATCALITSSQGCDMKKSDDSHECQGIGRDEKGFVSFPHQE